MSPTHKKRTWRSAARAHDKAKDLGALVPVDPVSRRSDGSPQVGPGQVYVTRTGEVFHQAWCLAVGTAWDNKPEGLLVVAESTVGGRRACKSCEDPLQQ
ncbi:hypothetical protein J2T11_000149 [Paenarthrobacter nicotinovorans]|uniref:hypothetical protein n=1 Tax=Paenarthrobacter nicotinovorans TaxID=29320 RepID=UPI00278A5E60|nr:hypothetical protein [Paenarthrobacter nicotinovorans]MDP9933825.1 hypothetical protein [Paenarthrobacter nicotinovorans]